ncbi:hypothetical protein QR680_016696 [Steinernema hermaphroditum]|uniref:Uncharacterized protein n=1 Tax=Steinernema hermaphroditum TaxID=289476 RepID=A0AA39LMD3_9BILA|nr:hypothetical protein QR680_016696 [Steinernema hermaphroditum]
MLSVNDKINMSLDDIIKMEKREKKAKKAPTSKIQNGPNTKSKAVKKGRVQKNVFKKGPNKSQSSKKGPNKSQPSKKGRFQGNNKRFAQKNQKVKK